MFLKSFSNKPEKKTLSAMVICYISLPRMFTISCASFVAASVPKYCYISILAVYTISFGS